MQDIESKCAFVTGGSGGIGLGIARALARHKVNVAIAGLTPEKLKAASDELRDLGVEVLSFELDVADRDAMNSVAAEVEAAFGKIHILVNNAGVGYAGVPLDQVSDADWDWVIGVNIRGAVNCLQAFLPRIKSHGEGGHVVNTSSVSGLFVHPEWKQGVYATTRFAVVGLSEALRIDLEAHSIGVSVLCPGPVDTDIFQSGRNRPERYGGSFKRPDDHPLVALAKTGMSPDLVGELVIEAIRRNDLYIFTHPELGDFIKQRHQRITDALDAAQDTLDRLRGGPS